MINLFFTIVIGAIVCCYVGNYLMERRKEEQEQFWTDFLHKMARTGRLVDEYYHPLPEDFIGQFGRMHHQEYLKNDLDALYLTPDIIVRLTGHRASVEHRPAYYEDSVTIG